MIIFWKDYEFMSLSDLFDNVLYVASMVTLMLTLLSLNLQWKCPSTTSREFLT